MAKLTLSLCLCFLLYLSPPLFSEETNLTLKRVVDGDTLLLSNGERVRLIGVDTPEIHPSKKFDRVLSKKGADKEKILKQGYEAKKFVQQVLRNKRVRLQFDPTNQSIQNRDRYGRLLAYVYFDPILYENPPPWLEDFYNSDLYQSGFLNGLLVYSGLGEAYTRFPFKYKKDFRNYENLAKSEGWGIWE